VKLHGVGAGWSTARASAVTIADTPSIFSRLRFLLGLRLPLLSMSMQQFETHQRKTGCPSWRSLPARTSVSNIFAAVLPEKSSVAIILRFGGLIRY
jgi:hypothetical protein